MGLVHLGTFFASLALPLVSPIDHYRFDAASVVGDIRTFGIKNGANQHTHGGTVDEGRSFGFLQFQSRYSRADTVSRTSKEL
ncbi:hypothetical protein EV356DRAFT_504380, partial [Viridothelium virens]